MNKLSKLLVLLTFSLGAIAQCPNPNTYFANLGTGTHFASNLQGTPFGPGSTTNGQSIRIDGTYIIDAANINFTNCSFEFGQFGKIIIDGGSQVYNIVIHNNEMAPCDEQNSMWDGIQVNEQTPTSIEGNTIRLAKIGISYQGLNVFEHLINTQNTFERCLNGIIVDNPVLPSNNLPGAIVKGGAINTTVNGSLHSTIGYIVKSTIPYTHTNLFNEPLIMENLANGLIVSAGAVSFTPLAHGSTFDNIYPSNHQFYNGSQTWYTDRWGSAIHLTTTDLSLKTSLTAHGNYSASVGPTGTLQFLGPIPITVTNSSAGISAYGSSIDISGCVFANLEERGVYAERNAIGTSAYNLVMNGCLMENIHSSTSAAGVHAIGDWVDQVAIQDCHIKHLSSPPVGAPGSPLSTHAGIRITEVNQFTGNIATQSPLLKTITENQIHDITNGIEVLSLPIIGIKSRIIISGNYLTDFYDLNPRGIQIVNTNYPQVVLNEIHESKNTNSFWAQNVFSGNFACNKASNFRWAFSFLNDNNDTRLVRNEMRDRTSHPHANGGVYIGFGFIGEQSIGGLPSFNTWIGNQWNTSGVYLFDFNPTAAAANALLTSFNYNPNQQNSLTSSTSPFAGISISFNQTANIPGGPNISCRLSDQISPNLNIAPLTNSYFSHYRLAMLWISDSLTYSTNQAVLSAVDSIRGSTLYNAANTLLTGKTFKTGLTIDPTMDSIAALAAQTNNSPSMTMSIDPDILLESDIYGPFVWHIAQSKEVFSGGQLLPTSTNASPDLTPTNQRQRSSNETLVSGGLIYPNPSSGMIQFQNLDEIIGKNFVVADLQGKVLMSGAVSSEVLDLSSLSSGIYIIDIEGVDDPMKIVLTQ